MTSKNGEQSSSKLTVALRKEELEVAILSGEGLETPRGDVESDLFENVAGERRRVGVVTEGLDKPLKLIHLYLVAHVVLTEPIKQMILQHPVIVLACKLVSLQSRLERLAIHDGSGLLIIESFNEDSERLGGTVVSGGNLVIVLLEFGLWGILLTTAVLFILHIAIGITSRGSGVCQRDVDFKVRSFLRGSMCSEEAGLV